MQCQSLQFISSKRNLESKDYCHLDSIRNPGRRHRLVRALLLLRLHGGLLVHAVAVAGLREAGQAPQHQPQGADVHREEHRRRAGQEHAHHHDHAMGQGPVDQFIVGPIQVLFGKLTNNLPRYANFSKGTSNFSQSYCMTDKQALNFVLETLVKLADFH